MFSFLPHLALMLCYYKNNCSLQKEWSLDFLSKTCEITENELQRKAERLWTWAAVEHFPTDQADFLLVSWWHRAAFSCIFLNKNSPPGRVPRTWLAVFRNDNETWVSQDSVESHEHSQSLGTFSPASIPGIRHGRLHPHQHQDHSSANECRRCRALQAPDVCWQAEQQRRASQQWTWRRICRELVSGMCKEGYFSHLQHL